MLIFVSINQLALQEGGLGGSFVPKCSMQNMSYLHWFHENIKHYTSICFRKSLATLVVLFS